MGLFYNNMADGDRLAYIVIGAVWISLTVIFFVLSILLARAWPKYRKLTKLFFREYLFYSPEELELINKTATVEKKNDEPTRMLLTVTRRKAVAACVGKVKLYVSTDDDHDLVLSVFDGNFHANESDRVHAKKFRFLGKLGNGKTAQFEIPQSKVVIAALFDTTSSTWCRDSIVIPAGVEDVCLSGKYVLDPLEGNPFIFDR